MSPSRIWLRRAVLMLVVGFAVAIPVTLLVRDNAEPEEPSRLAISDRFPLNPPVGDSEVKAAYRVPERWGLERQGETVVLSSPEGSVQIGIASPGEAREAGHVLDDATRQLRGTYRDVRVSPGSGRRVGGLPAKGAVVTARSAGTELRIVLAVAAGDKRAYLVEVFSAAGAPGPRVAEAQRFLDSLEFQG